MSTLIWTVDPPVWVESKEIVTLWDLEALHVMPVCIFSGAMVTEFKGDVSSVCVPSTFPGSLPKNISQH